MCGFLVGSVSESGSKASRVIVEDVLPICHSNPVGPIFEVAGGMCTSLFPDKDIVGLYYTSEDGEYGNHDSTPYFVDKVCDTIKANNSNGLCLVLTVATQKINPTSADDDVESEDQISSVLCLNAYLTNANSGNLTSSSSSKNGHSGRERTASFHSLKVQLLPFNTTAMNMNSTLDNLLLDRRQLVLHDVQEHMNGNGDISVKNAIINIDCNVEIKK